MAEPELLRRSGLFDDNYDLINGSDLFDAGVDPLAHFVCQGWTENRNPNPYFDVAWYCRLHPDRLHRNPLTDYVLGGEAVGRRPGQMFDPVWYRAAYGLPGAASPLRHWLDHRHTQRYSPLRAFDVAAYVAANPTGLRASGAVVLQGGTAPMAALEERLGELLCCREAAVFPTGWAAGYGAVRTLVRETDHVVLDAVSHACVQEGAVNATRNVHCVANCSHEAVRQRLARIRARDAGAGILVVTESLFSMDSTVPDLRAMQAVCRDHGATLLVDVAHDFGAIGDGGLGFIGDQGMLGEIDVVMGSFSKTFASNGGFVATNARGLKVGMTAFAGPLTFSNALSPVQAAIVHAALDIIRSREGAQRRRRLMANVRRLRAGLAARAFDVLGQPSAIVPVRLGGLAQARMMTRGMLSGGALVNLVEHPAVSQRNSRWRLQVMADHTPAQIDRLVATAVAAREQFGTAEPAEPNQ